MQSSGLAGRPPVGPDFVELESSKAFAETLKGVEAAIAAHGMAVFARIDHAQAAKAVVR